MKDDLVSITTLNGREKIPFKCGQYQRQLIQTQKGEVDLLYIKKQFYISCVCEVNEEQIQSPKGVLVELIDPKNTSRTCHECSYISKSNRKTQAIFKCKQCSFEANADFVASLNIRDKAVVNQPMVALNSLGV